ncbi:Glycosyltransferase [Entamoeba marina]
MIHHYEHFFLLLFIYLVLSYPPPVNVSYNVPIVKDLNQSYIIANHMKYSTHEKHYTIPILAHVTTYHERNSITLPIFSHLFDAIAFESLTIYSVNDQITIHDSNPYKHLEIQSKRVIILHSDIQQLPLPSKLIDLLTDLNNYDGVLIDTSISPEYAFELFQLLPNATLKYIIVSLETSEQIISQLQMISSGVFIDTQYYNNKAIEYTPLSPLAWIEEQVYKKFKEFNKAGFIVGLEGMMYCKHSTTHTSNIDYLRFIKQLNVTITYHEASHEHVTEAKVESERFQSDYCYSNYPSRYSIEERIKYGEKKRLNYFFNIF